MTRQEFEQKITELYKLGTKVGMEKDYNVFQMLTNKATGLIQEICQQVFKNEK